MPEAGLRHGTQRLAGNILPISISIVAALCVFQVPAARSQAPESPIAAAKQPPASELILEGEGRFGHFHIFAYSWWSDLYSGGIEYDRNSWGYSKMIKARRDYVAEILPIVILRQPTKTDVYGDPLTKARELTPGLAISPIGLRLLWRQDKKIKPYFIAKGGMIGFTQKALSSNAAYYDFLLQFGIGMQFKLTDRFDFRAGFSDIHFSDAFIVPSNPGLDSMTYNGGLAYHFGR